MSKKDDRAEAMAEEREQEFRSLPTLVWSAGSDGNPTVVATAIARELSAFIWAINREVVGSHAAANQ